VFGGARAGSNATVCYIFPGNVVLPCWNLVSANSWSLDFFFMKIRRWKFSVKRSLVLVDGDGRSVPFVFDDSAGHKKTWLPSQPPSFCPQINAM
jgi:hypothetical protein